MLWSTPPPLPQRCTSRTFDSIANRPADNKHIDYTRLRQYHYTLARKVIFHIQPPNSPSSNQNMCTPVRPQGRSASKKPWQTPTGRKPINMRAITYDTDRCEKPIQVNISIPKRTRTGDAVSAMTAEFNHSLLSYAKNVVPRQTRKSRIPGWFKDVPIRTECKQA